MHIVIEVSFSALWHVHSASQDTVLCQPSDCGCNCQSVCCTVSVMWSTVVGCLFQVRTTRSGASIVVVGYGTGNLGMIPGLNMPDGFRSVVMCALSRGMNLFSCLLCSTLQSFPPV